MSSDLRPGPDSRPTDELAGAEQALRALQHVLHPISRDEWSKATPCSEYDVVQLTEHLVNSLSALGGMADARLPERDPDDSVERQVVEVARPALDAWHRRGLDGTIMFGPNELPATVAAGVFSIEMLVHGWDFAAATGRPLSAAEPLAEYVLDLARNVITPDLRPTVGFADPVAVNDDAPALDRLVAFTGRDPAAVRA